MRQDRFGLSLAVKEHLISGKTITRLEALTLYGLSNLTGLISDLRKQGWMIKSRKIPLAAAIKRVNEFAIYTPPENLPIREILITDYWVSK